MQRLGLRPAVPRHRAGKHAPGLALALGGEGGGSLIKGPQFFILKVFDLEDLRGGLLEG